MPGKGGEGRPPLSAKERLSLYEEIEGGPAVTRRKYELEREMLVQQVSLIEIVTEEEGELRCVKGFQRGRWPA